MKYNKMKGSDDGFKGSIHSQREDLVALFSTTNRSLTKRKHAQNDNDSTEPDIKRVVSDAPPFLRHFQTSVNVPYEVGDTKSFNGDTCYFCINISQKKV